MDFSRFRAACPYAREGHHDPHAAADRGKVTGTPVGCACGDGVIDWQRVIGILKTAGFDGVLSVECGTPSRLRAAWPISVPFFRHRSRYCMPSPIESNNYNPLTGRRASLTYARAVLAACLLLVAETASGQSAVPLFKPGAIRVLIISGRNNHDWRTTTPFLRDILNRTGRFDVRVNEEPSGMTAQTLAAYDCVVLDYNGPRWGESAEAALQQFVAAGKGLVVKKGSNTRAGASVHALAGVVHRHADSRRGPLGLAGGDASAASRCGSAARGLASRALTTRFITAASNWLGSMLATAPGGLRSTVRVTRLADRAAQQGLALAPAGRRCAPARASAAWRREKARSCWVSRSPRRAAPGRPRSSARAAPRPWDGAASGRARR